MYLGLISGGLFVAAALYTWLLSKIRPTYEPDNTHWAAFFGFALIVAAFLALCLAGEVPLFGDLPTEAFYALFALCWIAYFPILGWREWAKYARRRDRDRANRRKS